MLHRTLQILCLFAFLSASGCAPSYNPATEPFKAKFPGTPQKMKKSIAPNGIALEIDITVFENASGAYLVMYSDYPQGHVTRTGAETVLTNVANGGAAERGGTITSRTAISLGSHPGQEITLTDPATGMKIRNRIYLVGDRLYQVMTVTKATTDKAKIERFLDSFEVK